MNEKRNETLEALYSRYAKGLYFYLLKMSGSDSIAEDLVQETFYRATLALSGKPILDAKAWLYMVARNAYLDEWRRRQRRKWIPFVESILPKESIISPDGIPERSLLENEAKQEMESILESLPEKHRTIYYLREFEGFTYQELESVMGISESQVKVTLHRARKRVDEMAKSRRERG